MRFRLLERFEPTQVQRIVSRDQRMTMRVALRTVIGFAAEFSDLGDDIAPVSCKVLFCDNCIHQPREAFRLFVEDVWTDASVDEVDRWICLASFLLAERRALGPWVVERTESEVWTWYCGSRVIQVTDLRAWHRAWVAFAAEYRMHTWCLPRVCVCGFERACRKTKDEHVSDTGRHLPPQSAVLEAKHNHL